MIRAYTLRGVRRAFAVLALASGPWGEQPVPSELATGWLTDPERKPGEPGASWGRPVHAAGGPDSALYVSSDAPGAIFRIWYAP